MGSPYGIGFLPRQAPCVCSFALAEGPIAKTTPFLFSADETADVGVDEATPVTEDYKERHNRFTGKIEKVTVEVESARRR